MNAKVEAAETPIQPKDERACFPRWGEERWAAAQRDEVLEFKRGVTLMDTGALEAMEDR